MITRDNPGEILAIFAHDNSFICAMDQNVDHPQAIQRIPQDRTDTKKWQPLDPSAGAKNVFNQFSMNSRVELEGKITWIDGILKTIPEGFNLEIIVAPNQPEDQPLTSYAINYRNQAGEYFGMQVVGVMQPGFVETNFYDGSYKATTGMVFYYSPADGDSGECTSAILTTVEGDSFLAISSLSRQQVQAPVEDLAPAE